MLIVALIGIDVGNTNCKLAIREGGGMRLISGHMPDNMVRDGDVSSPDTMAKFLKSVRDSERVRERNCALVLTSSQLYFRHVSLPPMTTSEEEHPRNKLLSSGAYNIAKQQIFCCFFCVKRCCAIHT